MVYEKKCQRWGVLKSLRLFGRPRQKHVPKGGDRTGYGGDINRGGF